MAAVIGVGCCCWYCSRSGGGSAPVGVISDDDAVLADLSVPVLFREVQAQIPGAVGVGGGVLPGSGGADNVVAGHRVVCFGSHSIRPPAANRGGLVVRVRTGSVRRSGCPGPAPSSEIQRRQTQGRLLQWYPESAGCCRRRCLDGAGTERGRGSFEIQKV